MTVLENTGPFTAADLERMPDDGRRYEIIDGALIVTPSPSRDHQSVVANLFRLLDAACPDELLVRFAPLDVTYAEDTVMQPDLLVVPADGYRDRDRPLRPLLAVEVLSPSTRSIDLLLKKERFERVACAAYWVIDPIHPRLIAWELRTGEFVEVADVSGADAFAATHPFPVSVTPSTLP